MKHLAVLLCISGTRRVSRRCVWPSLLEHAFCRYRTSYSPFLVQGNLTSLCLGCSGLEASNSYSHSQPLSRTRWGGALQRMWKEEERQTGSFSGAILTNYPGYHFLQHLTVICSCFLPPIFSLIGYFYSCLLVLLHYSSLKEISFLEPSI